MKKGIDVSKWQQSIDWKKVKAAGIEFAIIRAAYGTEIDRLFEYNYKNAKAAGMPVGCYLYSIATSKEEAEKEADYLISILKGKQLEFPVGFDIEDTKKQGGLTRERITEVTKAFCDRMEKAGYYVCIYSMKAWLTDKLLMSKLSRYDVWVAQWNKECTYTGNYGMWQYSDSGKVAGIDGNVDLDYAYKDYAKIIKEAGLNGFTKEVAKPIETPKKKTVAEVAEEICDKKGGWGNGLIRKKKLAAAGYDVEAVQAKVNEIMNEREAAKKHVKGAKVVLKNKPIYPSATSRVASGTKTGTFYLYDGVNVNGRYRITVKKNMCGKKPTYQYVTGWIDY